MADTQEQKSPSEIFSFLNHFGGGEVFFACGDHAFSDWDLFEKSIGRLEAKKGTVILASGVDGKPCAKMAAFWSEKNSRPHLRIPPAQELFGTAIEAGIDDQLRKAGLTGAVMFRANGEQKSLSARLEKLGVKTWFL